MIPAYCPWCGQATMQARSTTEYFCSHCHNTFWNNPKASTVIVFYKDSQILVSKRALEPNKGKYDFPGGFVEYNEQPKTAAIREVLEETGVVIRESDLQLFGVHTREYIPGVTTTDIIYVTTTWTGDFTPKDDVASLIWKPLAFMASSDFVDGYETLYQEIMASNVFITDKVQ